MKLSICLLPLFGISSAVNSHAFECIPYLDSESSLSVGSFRLGDSSEQISIDATRSDSCLEDKKNDYFDCEYTINGVSYLVFGKVIVRNEVRDLEKFQGKLPIGLTKQDTLGVVARRLSKLPARFPAWSISSNSAGEIVIGTDYCIRSVNGALSALYITFDQKDRIKGFGTRLNW